MALLTTISGIPLFDKLEEALRWGASQGLNGHHTHSFKGQIGYMGGANHSDARSKGRGSIRIANVNNTTQATTTRRVNPGSGSSGSSSGGGGGGGY